MFSPYYAWAGRREPENHCAINVALYGKPSRWAMTERGRGAMRRNAHSLVVGASGLSWNGRTLTIGIDEITAPLPSRLRGVVRITPPAIQPVSFDLDARGRHRWHPIAPVARLEAEFERPGLSWEGTGYLDSNSGGEPLEAGFSDWTWSRADMGSETAVVYDAARRDGSKLALALRFDAAGNATPFASPAVAALPRSKWLVARATRSETGGASIVRSFEDTPFYARSLIETQMLGRKVHAVHESLDLGRFRSPVIRAMLPFRMPRAILSRG